MLQSIKKGESQKTISEKAPQISEEGKSSKQPQRIMLAVEQTDDMSQPMAVLLSSIGTLPKRLAKNETPTYVWK